jgi:hypothetical protein
MSNAVPPPNMVKQEPPRLLRIAGGLWLLGVAAGVAAIVLAVLDRENRLTDLQDTALTIDSQAAVEDAEQVALIAFWGTLGVFAAVLLITALLVPPLLRGRGWIRWTLATILVLDVGAVLLVQAFLESDAGAFPSVPQLAVLQLALAFIALVLTLLPPVSRWFKGPHLVQ